MDRISSKFRAIDCERVPRCRGSSLGMRAWAIRSSTGKTTAIVPDVSKQPKKLLKCKGVGAGQVFYVGTDTKELPAFGSYFNLP